MKTTIGFFADAKDATAKQLNSTIKLISGFDIEELRHCDLIGSTITIHEIVARLNFPIIIYPIEKNFNNRAFCAATSKTVIEQETNFKDAILSIINKIDVLIILLDTIDATSAVVERIAKKENVKKIYSIDPTGNIKIFPDMNLFPKGLRHDR